MEDDEENENELPEIKSIILGEAGVGKSNLLNAAVDLRFEENTKSTVAAWYVQKRMKIFNKDYQVKLWDTAGQEKYRSFTKLFYLDSKVVIFVYDITNKKSFTELDYWINQIKEALGDEPVMGIVGNKNDLIDKKEVDEDIAKKYAEDKGMKLKLLSVKDDPKNFKIFLRMLVKDYLIKTEKIEDRNTCEIDNETNENNHGSCGTF